MNSGDVGYLCSNEHGRINKWAKYKPVIIDSPTQTHVYNDDNWYKGDDGKCGLQITVATPAMAVYETVVKGYLNGDYKYVLPDGKNHWWRLLDFEGYWHEAKPFLSTGVPKSSGFLVNLQTSTALTFKVTYSTDPKQLQLSDFDDLGMDVSCKLVAAVFNTDPTVDGWKWTGAPIHEVISTNTIEKSPSVTINFEKADLNKGDNFYVVLFLLSTASGTRYYTIPFDDDNYTIFHVFLTDAYAIEGSILNFNGNGNASESDPIETNGGEKDIAIAMTFNNNYNTAVTIGNATGNRFKIRAVLGHGFGEVEMTGSTTIPANRKNWQATFTAPKLFKKAVGSMASNLNKLDTSLRIQIQDTTGATQSWQQVGPQRTVWFKR